MDDVVERYLLQLRSLLPAGQRDGVAAEIGESIVAAIDERRRELGHDLDAKETAQILERYGHPVALAGRYLPMQHLIGPRVFPLYWHAVRAVLTVIAAIGGVVAAIALVTEPRATQATIQVATRFLWIALDAAAIVTLIFVLLERNGGLLSVLGRLEARGRGKRVEVLGELPRGDTVIDLAAAAILLLWWVGWLGFPTVEFDVQVELGTGLRALYAPVISLCLVDVARLSVDFVYPYRTASRVGAAIVSRALWLVLLGIALFSHDLLQAAPSIQDPEEIERIVSIAERGARIVLTALAAWTAIRLAADVRRLFRRG